MRDKRVRKMEREYKKRKDILQGLKTECMLEGNRLDPEIMALTNEEITHFIGAHCKDQKCKICLRVWRAYGREPIKTSMGQDPKTKLFRKNKRTL